MELNQKLLQLSFVDSILNGYTSFFNLDSDQNNNEENIHMSSIQSGTNVGFGTSKIIKSAAIIENFTFVQGGTFTMGSNENNKTLSGPEHLVTLDDFEIGKFLLTQAQWLLVTGNNPCHFQGHLLRPVENVSWLEVLEFIRTLNDLDLIFDYRLPTEAEWEYTATGGNQQEKYTYAGSNDSSIVGWTLENSLLNSAENEPEIPTMVVGQKKPNGLGLYDMTGNVAEWCYDYQGEYQSATAVNPCNNKMPGEGEPFRVTRGGSISNSRIYCENVSRGAMYEHEKDHYTGFRLVRQLKGYSTI